MSLDVAFLNYLFDKRPTFQRLSNVRANIKFDDERVKRTVDFLVGNLAPKWTESQVPTRESFCTILEETDESYSKLAKFIQNKKVVEYDWEPFGLNLEDFVLAFKEREWGRAYNGKVESLKISIEQDSGIEKSVKDLYKLIESKDSKLIAPATIDELLDKERMISGEIMYPTHIKNLNYALGEDPDKGGIAAGEITIIGGYSNVGKSLAAQSLFTHFLSQHIPSVYFNLEVRPDLFVSQMFSQITGQRIVKGKDQNRDYFEPAWDQYQEFIRDRKDEFILYNKDGPRNIVQLEEYVERHAAEGYEIMFLDTINSLIHSDGEARKDLFTKVMNILEGLVKKYNIALIATAQIKQSLMQQIDKRPNLWDIGESVALQQKAGTVIGIYRSDKFGDGSEKGKLAKCDYTSFMLLKLRNRSAEHGEFIKVAYDPFRVMYVPYNGPEPEFTKLTEEDIEGQLC
jgi:replicative DNA helicase